MPVAPMLELTIREPGSGRSDDELVLTYELRQRSRQRVVLASGREAGLLLPPGTTLEDGDRIRSTDGASVVVRAAAEAVSTARAADPVLLARACYHLGNRHVAVQIGEGWLRYLPDHVLDDMVRGLGLEVEQECTPFAPERGAYHGQSPAHRHEHGHGHAH
jgi:urease accessory protein